MVIPQSLRDACSTDPERATWLERLPSLFRRFAREWRLRVDEPWSHATAAWVAPAVRADGTRVVLKLGMPHMEAAHEIDGLRFWNGDPTVQLIEADSASDAMLLERCDPGTPLSALPEPEQDLVIAHMLRRLWRTPAVDCRVRPLSEMLAYWTTETSSCEAEWIDGGIVHAGLQTITNLSATASVDTLLATDLHAGNVLRAERRPWLVIDPKPFVGDPAFDVTQHLLNCRERLRTQPIDTVQRLADLTDLDAERCRRWLFARVATARSCVTDSASVALARSLA